MKNILIVVVLAVCLMSCNNRSEENRSYEEIHIEASKQVKKNSEPQGSMKGSAKKGSSKGSEQIMKGTVTTSPVSWVVPSVWLETKGSGMRLVTFKAEPPNSIDCSIISLGGIAGGFEANVIRWIGQINIQLTGEEQKKFLGSLKEEKTTTGLPVTVVDFTDIQKEKNDMTPSMMAAIIQLEGKTLFIKMTGDKSAIVNNKGSFKELVYSISLLKSK